MSLPLRLRLTTSPRREPAAWFLPGDGPRAWLAELVTWSRRPIGPCLHPVPGPDGAPCGVLVLSSGPRQTARPSPRARGYAALGSSSQGVSGRLYLPVEAILDPPVASSELDALPGDLTLLHPVAGLVAFSRGEALSLRDLLALPARSDASWGHARAGDPPLPELRTIRVRRVTNPEQLLKDARGDIGEAASEQLPPAPEERPSPADDDPTRWAGRHLARAARWFTKPGSPDGDSAKPGEGSWIDRLEGWSKVPLETLQELRQRELQRLLGMLERDPDQGLRYALPLGGVDAGGRGIAPPSAHLGPRDLRLDLGQARGGEPRQAPWEVDPELLARLRERYRVAAGRELRLGRHERAAYIFLQLLGDTEAAATALQQGRHYREAAFLYRERLGRPRSAALCLERGGLLLEAAEIYELEREHLEAAALYGRLGRPALAERLYREAVQAKRRIGDERSAARILEEKVRAPDEALALLASTWPNGRQAAGCLQDRFALLGRLGRHEEASRILRDFQQDLAPASREALLVESLVKIAGDYPDRETRARARDTARVVAGSVLPIMRPTVAERMVRAVGRLDLQDRLLARDVRRYVAKLRSQRPRAPRRLSKVRWEHEFRLPLDVAWQVAVPVEGGFYAAGRADQGPVVLRACWDGAVQWRWWPPGSRRSGRLLLAAPSAYAEGPVILSRLGQALPTLTLPATEQFPLAREVGAPGWLPEGTQAVAVGDGVVWAAYAAEGEVVLSSFDASARALLTCEHLFDQSSFGATPRISLEVCGRRLAVGWGQTVEFHRGRERLATVDLEHDVRRMISARERLAVSTESGGVAIWLRGERAETHAFAADLSAPHVAFSGDARLVAMTRFEGRAYATDAYGLRHAVSFAGPGEDLVALLPAGRGALACLSPSGRVRLFHLPGA